MREVIIVHASGYCGLVTLAWGVSFVIALAGLLCQCDPLCFRNSGHLCGIAMVASVSFKVVLLNELSDLMKNPDFEASSAPAMCRLHRMIPMSSSMLDNAGGFPCYTLHNAMLFAVAIISILLR